MNAPDVDLTQPLDVAEVTKLVRDREHCEVANIQQEPDFSVANRAANKRRASANITQEPAEWDALALAPKEHPAMFYGALGRLAQQAAQGTEVNPVAAMAAAMTWISAGIGRNTCVVIGDEWHHLRLFTLHVGRSSRGGKGMALGLLKRIQNAMSELPDGETLRPKIHLGGLSSREGLAWLIHDGYKEGKDKIPAIMDKRLFVLESEFANVLAQGKRESNTLSTALRDAWDGISIAPATKGCRVWATRPHIALHGCITPGELRKRMASNDLSNGFANRFLMVWGERRGSVPFPSRTSDDVVQTFASEFSGIITHGLAGYPARNEPQRLRFDRQATGLYADCYNEFKKPHPAGELMTSLLERRPPMLLRIAGIFAVGDRTSEIRREHIEAAKAWVEYDAETKAMIFALADDAETEVHRSEHAEKLSAWLRGRGDWQPRTAIVRDCFQNHLSKTAIDAALERLSMEGRIERREVCGEGSKKRTEYRMARGATSQFAASSQRGSQIESPADIASSQVRNVRSAPIQSASVFEGEV